MKTRTFRLNKLVRDKIVESTIAQGGEVQSRQLSKDEKVTALIDKIIEEATELKRSQRPLGEMADIKEVLHQLAIEQGIDEEDIEREQQIKRLQNGGFEEGHFIEIASLPEENEWAKHYVADPTRFPEVKGD